MNYVSVVGHKTSSMMWKAKVALQNPRLAWAYLRRNARIQKLTRSSNEIVRSYYTSLNRQAVFTSRINNSLSEFSNLGLGFCGRSSELYVIVRILRPNIVVETGVANGVSSAYILRAMEDNGVGKLISIDLPYPGVGSILPEGKQTGWLVPDDLRHRWTLILERSLDVLPGILKELGNIDVFLHDSDHSYNYMKAEMELAWPYVVEDGVLMADDAWQNSAFRDFCRQVDKNAIMIANLGAVRKAKT